MQNVLAIQSHGSNSSRSREKSRQRFLASTLHRVRPPAHQRQLWQPRPGLLPRVSTTSTAPEGRGPPACAPCCLVLVGWGLPELASRASSKQVLSYLCGQART